MEVRTDVQDESAPKQTGMLSGRTRQLIAKWFSRGSWAIADQVVYGLSTFLVNVLLGSWVSPAAYGGFAISFASLILVLAFYNAIFIEPMLVFGSRRFSNRFPEYLKTLLKGHVLFSLLGMTVAIAVASFIRMQGTPELGNALLGLGIAIPFFFLAWLMRRACYVNHNPKLATFGGSIFLVGVIISLYVMNQFGVLTPLTAWISMAFGGLLSGLFLMTQLGVSFSGKSSSRFSNLILRRHWIYSRWAIAARLPMRIPRIIVLSALPIWAGLEATGTLQALSNPVTPIVQVLSAVSLLLIPTLARKRGTIQFSRLVTRSFAAFIVVTGLYWLALGLLNEFVIKILYGGNYADASALLWYLGAQPVFTAAISVFGAAFSAIEQPKYVFWSYLTGAAIGLPITLGLMAKYQLIGAVFGSLVMSFITTAALICLYVVQRDKFRNTDTVDAPATDPAEASPAASSGTA